MSQKTLVATVLHFTDYKGFTKIIEWNEEKPAPKIYRFPKICSNVLEEIKETSIPQLPKQNTSYDFVIEREKIIEINDRFYNLMVFYKEV